MLLKTGYRRSNGAGRWRSTNIYFGEKLKTYYDGWCIFCTYITSIQFDMETKMKVESQRRRVSWIYVACCGLAYIFRWGNLISYSGWNDEFKWWLLLPGHWLEEHICVTFILRFLSSCKVFSTECRAAARAGQHPTKQSCLLPRKISPRQDEGEGSIFPPYI